MKSQASLSHTTLLNLLFHNLWMKRLPCFLFWLGISGDTRAEGPRGTHWSSLWWTVLQYPSGYFLKVSVYPMQETRHFLSYKQVRGHHMLCYRFLFVHTYPSSVVRTEKTQTLTPAFPQCIAFLLEVLWQVSSIWTWVNTAEENWSAYRGTSPRWLRSANYWA